MRTLASSAGLLFLECTARINAADLTGGEEGARAAQEVADALAPRLQGLPGLLDSAFVGALETAAELSRTREPDWARALLQRALAHAERSGQVSDRERLRKVLTAPKEGGAPCSEALRVVRSAAAAAPRVVVRVPEVGRPRRSAGARREQHHRVAHGGARARVLVRVLLVAAEDDHVAGRRARSARRSPPARAARARTPGTRGCPACGARR